MSQRMHALRRMLSLAMLGILLIFSMLLPISASAQDKKYAIALERNANITIQRDGVMHFEETWHIRYVGGPFRFISRTIPLDRATDITHWTVSEGNLKYRADSSEKSGTYSVAEENGNATITWYYPSTTSNERTFTLAYDVEGGLRIYPDGDQFFWTVLEDTRGYRIDHSTITLHLPQDVARDQLKIETNFSTENYSVVDGQTIRFSDGPFADGTDWRLRVQFPHGLVQATAAPWQVTEDQHEAQIGWIRPWLILGSVVLSLLVLVGGGFGLYLLWYKVGRDAPADIAAEFMPEPPEDVPPGIIGTLIDENAELRDIIATMVDLARRGYMRFIEEQSSGIFGIGGGREFTFARGTNADESSLRPYERYLLDTIFGGQETRRFSDLRQRFYTAIPELQSMLYQETVQQGYFAQSPQSVRGRYAFFAIAIGILAFVGWCAVGAIASDITTWVFVPPVMLGVIAFVMLCMSGSMPARSKKGATFNARWQAFKRYLQHMQQYGNVEQARDQFERFLPYAIVFGIEHEVVNTFTALGAPAPSWYVMPGYGYGYGHRGTVWAGGGQGAPISTPGSGGGGGMPSLDQAANNAFTGLSSMSEGLFSMLNDASSTFTSRPAPSGSSSSGGWSGGGGGFSGSGGGGSSSIG